MVVPDKIHSSAQNARVIGRGDTTLVLSHGFGTDQSIWDGVVPWLLLAPRFRVVLFDWNFSAAADLAAASDCSDPIYNGFADDLISLIDQYMSLNGVIFVGHSMAGMIGCLAAIRRPDLFRRLVLLGASPRYLNTEGYEGGFELPEVESLFALMASDFRRWALSFSRLIVGESHPDAAEQLRRLLLRMRPEAALAVGRAVFLSDFRDVLERVPVPCTVVGGVSDPVVPVPVARYMRSKIGGETTLVMLAGDGHLPQLTSPVDLGRLLVDLADDRGEGDSRVNLSDRVSRDATI